MNANVDVRSILERDTGKMPIWQLDEMGLKEVVWQHGGTLLRRGNKHHLPESLIWVLRHKDQVPELFRKLYPGQIRPALTPTMLLDGHVIFSGSFFEQAVGRLGLSDEFGRRSLIDTLCYNTLINAARNAPGREKRRIIRLPFNIEQWPASLPELKLEATDLIDGNDLIGKMYDAVLLDDFLLGFDYKAVQCVLAKKWPHRLCSDCGIVDGCECGEIKYRERTGEFKVDVVVDEWQATQQSIYGLAIQMNDQYHNKNMARGVMYALHRCGVEHVEFTNRILDENHGVRPNLDLDNLIMESTDRRIWMTVMSLVLQINLYDFLVNRYRRMAEEREAGQAQLSNKSVWQFTGWEHVY